MCSFRFPLQQCTARRSPRLEVRGEIITQQSQRYHFALPERDTYVITTGTLSWRVLFFPLSVPFMRVSEIA